MLYITAATFYNKNIMSEWDCRSNVPHIWHRFHRRVLTGNQLQWYKQQTKISYLFFCYLFMQQSRTSC